MGHHTPLAVVEQFGILDAVHPGRIDLGLGRSGFKRLQERAGSNRTRPADGSPTATAGQSAHRERPGDPATVLVRPPHRVAPRRAPDQTAPTAERRDPRLRRTDRRRPGADRRHLPRRRRYRSARHPRRGRRSSRSGSSGAAAATAPRSPGGGDFRSRPTTTSPRARCSRRSRRIDRRSGRRRRWPDRTCPSRPMSSWRPPTTRPANSPPDTHRGCAASAAARVRSRSRRPTRPARSSGRTTIRRWCRIGSTPSSSDRPIEWPSSSASSPTETGADELLITTITHDQRDRIRSYELLADEWAARNQLARVG